MSVFREISDSQRKAMRFLQIQLADGAKEVRELQTLARTQGIYPRTLTASRKMLKIEVSRNGQTGEFYWQLPTS